MSRTGTVVGIVGAAAAVAAVVATVWLANRDRPRLEAEFRFSDFAWPPGPDSVANSQRFGTPNSWWPTVGSYTLITLTNTGSRYAREIRVKVPAAVAWCVTPEGGARKCTVPAPQIFDAGSVGPEGKTLVQVWTSYPASSTAHDIRVVHAEGVAKITRVTPAPAPGFFERYSWMLFAAWVVLALGYLGFQLFAPTSEAKPTPVPESSNAPTTSPLPTKPAESETNKKQALMRPLLPRALSSAEIDNAVERNRVLPLVDRLRHDLADWLEQQMAAAPALSQSGIVSPEAIQERNQFWVAFAATYNHMFVGRMLEVATQCRALGVHLELTGAEMAHPETPVGIQRIIVALNSAVRRLSNG